MAGEFQFFSRGLALGSWVFVESVKREIGSKAAHRAVEQIDETRTLREGEAYDAAALLTNR